MITTPKSPRFRRIVLRPGVATMLVVAVLWTFAMPLPAALAQAPNAGRRVALLVGVNKYDKRGFRDLEFAERDVEELAELLKSGGYEIHLLTGSSTGQLRAELKNIEQAIEKVLAGRKKEDLLLFGFAGHGLQVEVTDDKDTNGKPKLHAESFYCPCDGERGNPKTLLPLGKLFEEIDRRGGDQNLVLVDACREDPTRGRGLDGSVATALPEGLAVLFGCRSGQKTFESKNAGGGHGVLFHFVLEGLRGGAKNEEGDVTWDRLTEFVRSRVSRETGNLLGDPTVRQTPNLIANLPGEPPVLFRRRSPAGSADTSFQAEVQECLSMMKRKSEPREFLMQHAPNRLAAWRQAAQAGSANAQWLYGNCYFYGAAVSLDQAQAFEWFKKAAVQDLPVAQEIVGVFYEFGWVVARSREEAANWYRKAADAGWANAQYNYGRCLQLGIGVATDPQQAVQWYRRSAAQGSALGEDYLGGCYAFAIGLTRDPAEGARWFRKAADRGWALAQFNLGNCYANGSGVTKDVAEAVRWYRKAADQNFTAAQSRMGYSYHNGQGVQQDFAEAQMWYRKAAAQNDLFAMWGIGELYANGSGVAMDQVEAAKWFRKAADGGYSGGMNAIGFFNENGLGMPRNTQAAIEWYRKSAALNDQWARAQLKRLKAE